MSSATSQQTVEDRFAPNSGAQEEFFTATERQLLYSGSFGAGKSRAGCEKGYYLNQRYPGNRGLIVRKSLVDVRASTIEQSLLEDVIPESHIIDHNKGDCIIKHHTGRTDPSGEEIVGEIHYYGVTGGEKTSSDDLPRKIGSTEYGWIFVDEGTELTQGEWNQLVGRLRYNEHEQNGYVYPIPIQQIFTATNPDSPNHWMHDYFGLGGTAPPNRAYWTANLWDNADNLPQEYIEDLESSLSGMYYERYVEGQWVGAEGMVYDEFDPELHLIHPDKLNEHFALPVDVPDEEQWTVHGRQEYSNDEVSYYVSPPADWRIYRTIDFGYRNPFVCQFWARSPDDELILFREIYDVEKTTSKYAPRIESLTPRASPLEMTTADHDAENHETLRQKGISTVNADKSVEAGIQSVKERFMRDDRGRPRLFFMQGARAHEAPTRLVLDDDPLKTVEEIYDYEWDEDEEEPVKENDHGMDAMRYLIHTLDSGPQHTLDDFKNWEEAFN
jgi:hypothetical protein